jgi:hypothetical protein
MGRQIFYGQKTRNDFERDSRILRHRDGHSELFSDDSPTSVFYLNQLHALSDRKTGNRNVESIWSECVRLGRIKQTIKQARR